MATTQTTKAKTGNVPVSETQQSRASTSSASEIPRPQTGHPVGSVMSTPAQKTREERLEELSRLRTQQTETPSDEERDRKQREAIEALLKIKEDQRRKDKERRERRRTIHQLEKELNPSGSRQSSSSGDSDQTTSTRARGSTSASSAKRIGDLESKNQSLEQELQQLRLSQGRQLSQPSSDSTVIPQQGRAQDIPRSNLGLPLGMTPSQQFAAQSPIETMIFPRPQHQPPATPYSMHFPQYQTPQLPTQRSGVQPYMRTSRPPGLSAVTMSTPDRPTFGQPSERQRGKQRDQDDGGPGGGEPSGGGYSGDGDGGRGSAGGPGDGGNGPGGGDGDGGGPHRDDWRIDRSNQQGFSTQKVPRATNIGKFDPKRRRALAFWVRLEHFREGGVYTDAAIISILHGCFEGEANDWWDTVWPRPMNWDEWRETFFRRWTGNPNVVSKRLEARRFKPEKETLSQYLYDKYWLVGEQAVARMVSRSHLRGEVPRFSVPEVLSIDPSEICSRSFTMDFLRTGKSELWTRSRTRRRGRTTSRRWFAEKECCGVRFTHLDMGRTFLRTARERGRAVRDEDQRIFHGQSGLLRLPRHHSDRKPHQDVWANGRLPSCPTPSVSNVEKTARRVPAFFATSRVMRRLILDCKSHPEQAKIARRVEKEFVARVLAGRHESSEEDLSSDGEVQKQVRFDEGEDIKEVGTRSGDSSSEDPRYDVKAIRVRTVVRRLRSTQADGPGRLHESASAYKLAVWLNKNNDVYCLTPYELLVDSGSEISLISTQAARKIAPNAIWHPPQPIELHAFDDGLPQRTKAVVMLPIVFECEDGNRTEMCEFHVVDRCSDGWLLGVDNIENLGMLCDPTSWTVEFKRGTLQRANMLFPEGGAGAGKSSKDSLTISKADLDTIHDIQNQSRGQATVDLSGLSQTDDTIIEELEIDIPSSETKPAVATSAALTTGQRKRLSEELAKHEVWPTKQRPIGLYRHGVFDIKLKIGQENWTHSEPPRRTSPAQKEAIDKTLKEHDEMGLSEPGESPYTSGIVLVPQKDKIRLCNDYRPLNSVTEDDQYFFPATDEVHDCLHDSHFFTIVDCNKGYHQFGLSDRARLLLAFATYRGVRIWNRMPFGPKNAVAFFQRTIDKILGKYRRKCAIAYLDDIIIFSPDFDTHVRDVGNVLKELADAGLTIAPKKCAFAFKSLQVLGYRATELGTMVDEEKVKAVKALPSPTTATEARRLFAMASWYRRFIPRFAILARPMNEAINRQPFAWTEIEEDAITKIKEALTTPPVLRRADFKRPFILDVDASAVGFGAALIQKDDEGKEHPIIFLSRQTKDAERRYPATHLELQAIEWAVKKLQHYLDGGKIIVRSDHKALLWLWNLKSTDLSHRLQRPTLSLAPLREKIKIEYRKGTSNQVADALSRAPVEEVDTTKDEVMMQIPIKEEKEPEQQKKKSALVATLNSHSQTLSQNKVSTSQNAASQSLSQTKLSTSQNTVTADSTSQEIPTTTSSSLTFDIDEKTSWAKAYQQDPHYQRIWRRLINDDKSRRQTEDAEEDTGNHAARGKRDRVGSEGSQANEEKKELDREGLKEKVDVEEKEGLGKKKKKGSRGWKRLKDWKQGWPKKEKGGHDGGRAHDDGKDLKKEEDGHKGGHGRDDGQDLVAGGNEKKEVVIQEKETSPMTEGASGSTRRRSPRLKTSRRTRRSKPPTQFFVQEGFLFERKWSSTDEVIKLCVPEEKIPLVIHEFHNSYRARHPSSQRTINAMKETFTFPDFGKRIKEHVKSCFECQLNKTRHHLPYGELHPIFSPSQVFHTIGIDFVTGLTPSGREHYDSITVCADKFSKFAFFWPSKTTDTASDTAQRFLERAYPYTGLPQRIISDRDVRFTSQFWQTLVKKLDIQHTMSTAYHPQTDGQVERLNQQLATLLRHTVALDQHDWAEQLPSAMMAYNQTIHETTQQRPYMLVFGRLPRIFPLQFLTSTRPEKESGVDRLLSLHQEIQERIVKAQEKQKHQYDAHHEHWRPRGGDWIWVRTEHYKTRLDPTQRSKIKLGPKHIGPFRIKTEVTAGAYELDTPSWFKGHNVLPVQALEPFLGDPAKVVPRKITGVEEEGARPEQRIITFLGRRPTQFLDGDRYDYLVKWIGDIQPTWQCDRRLPGLHWARKDLEKHLRQELRINRLSPSRELVLDQARDRARVLKALDEGKKEDVDGSGTSLSSVGAGVTDRIEKGQAN